LSGTVVITKPKNFVSVSASGKRRWNKPQKASNDVFQEPHCLCLDQTDDHIAQDGSNGIKAFIGRADIPKSSVVEKDFLHNENGDGLGKLTSSFHNTETEWDDLGGQ